MITNEFPGKKNKMPRKKQKNYFALGMILISIFIMFEVVPSVLHGPVTTIDVPHADANINCGEAGEVTFTVSAWDKMESGGGGSGGGIIVYYGNESEKEEDLQIIRGQGNMGRDGEVKIYYKKLDNVYEGWIDG